MGKGPGCGTGEPGAVRGGRGWRGTEPRWQSSGRGGQRSRGGPRTHPASQRVTGQLGRNARPLAVRLPYATPRRQPGPRTATRAWARPLPGGPHESPWTLCPQRSPPATSTLLADEAEAARTHPSSRFYLGPREKAAPHKDRADNFLLNWQTTNACHPAPLCSHAWHARAGGETRARRN